MSRNTAIAISQTMMTRLQTGTHSPARVLEILSKNRDCTPKIEMRRDEFYERETRWVIKLDEETGQPELNQDRDDYIYVEEELVKRRLAPPVFLLNGDELDPNKARFYVPASSDKREVQ